MLKLDQCHEQMVRALQKDGWTIKSPYSLFVHKRRAYIDLSATRQTNGVDRQILFVEVKCFADRKSSTDDLYGAIGQYIVYHMMMLELGMTASLYLAIPNEVFTRLFDRIVRKTIEEYKIKLVIVNLEEEKIVRWIE
jgi:hypothetical protein